MSKIQPINEILLSLKKPLQDTIKLNGGLELYLDTTWQHEQHVTCEGIVEGIPTDNPFNGELQIGDEVCFSYSVVAERRFADAGHHFHPSITSNYRKQFINGKDERINVVCVPGKISKKWVCTFLDGRGNFKHGFEGTEAEMERWLAQFPFGDIQGYEFRNLVVYNGKQYWKCEYHDIFAKKVGKKLVSIGEQVILNPINRVIPKDVLKDMGILWTKDKMTLQEVGRAKVISGGRKIGLKGGDIVGFNDRIKQSYRYFGREYYLVKQDSIYGKWQTVT